MRRASLSFAVPVVAIASLAAALAVSARGSAQHASAIAVPEALKERPNETIAMVVPAKGVQIYECKAKSDQPSAYEWAFVAPEADLFDAGGQKIGKHYAGPTWEAMDGSKIKGTLKARADAPQPEAIPWLLLTAAAEGPNGAFSAITGVQRVNTVGGAAPKTTCGTGNADAVVRVPYTADYYLLAER